MVNQVQGEGGNKVQKGSSKASACMKNSQINERKTEQSCVRNPSKAHVPLRVCHSSTPSKDTKESNMFHTVSATQASPGSTTELGPSTHVQHPIRSLKLAHVQHHGNLSSPN